MSKKNSMSKFTELISEAIKIIITPTNSSFALKIGESYTEQFITTLALFENWFIAPKRTWK